MTKYQQLSRLIELSIVQRDNGSGKMFAALSRIWNGWSQLQGVIDSCPDPVEKMAEDYLKFLYAGYPKPEWFQHLSDLG